MKTQVIQRSWMDINGLRLDSGPYLTGALEARALLERLRARKEPLQTLTRNGLEGIFNGPRFARSYVEDPAYGIPFLGSTDILAADLSTLPLLSRRQVAEAPELLIDEGWTLITCSGTIGRMAYARAEMKGMAGSQDFMRVVPDPDRILPGYLYAYLSSRFGVPQIISGTYGAIIQHIEPYHLADLQVPRLGDDSEKEADRLVSAAAQNRSTASRLLSEAKQDVIDYFGFCEPNPQYGYAHPDVSTGYASSANERLDAYYYARWNKDAVSEFAKVPARSCATLGEVCADVFIPDIFKRAYADDPAFGYPYITGSDAYKLAPTPDQYLMKTIAEQGRLLLKKGMILVQDSGQLGGLIGRPVLVGRYLNDFACTNNMVRIVPHTPEDQGYLFAILSTDYGVRLLMREATGSSIPHLEEKRIKRITIPWPTDPAIRASLGSKVMLALQLRDDACDQERSAVRLVEEAIERGSV